MRRLILLLALSLGLWPCTRAAAQSCHLSLDPVHFGTLNTATLRPSAIAVATLSCTPQDHAIYACLAFDQGEKILANSTHAAQTLPFELTSDNIALGDGGAAPMLGPFQPSAQGITVSFGVALNGVSAMLPSGLYHNDESHFMVSLYDQPATSALESAPTCTQIIASGLPSVRVPLLVSAEVPPVCSVTATPMSFGQISLLNHPVAASSSIQVQCNTASEIITLDNGRTGTGPVSRFLVSGLNSVTYGIYQDAAHTRPWGSTKGSDAENASGDAVLTAYGLVPVQTTPPPGSYTDEVSVTVSY